MSEYSLLDRARRSGTPLIEGDRAIFVWEGENAPRLMADFNGWDESRLVDFEWAGENVWACGVELPEDAYIEYALWLDGERVPDPLNSRKTPNGMGKTNHYFYMSKGRPTPYLRPVDPQRRGQVCQATLRSGWFFGNGQRRVHFYQPAVEQAVPLIVVWDGQDYLQRVKLPVILDNLIGLGKIQPVALAMIESWGPGRGAEYMCSDATLMMLVELLLPEAHKYLNLIHTEDAPGSYGVLGASAGGVNALYTGLRLPHIFGHVLAQSGAFTLNDFDMVVWDLVERMDPERLKVWLSVGKFEYLLNCNQRMGDFMAQKGIQFDYHEYSGGHNYPAWRDDLPAGLEYLFGQRV